LHDGSFVDDPTRIFRALRYASRYGFRLDEHTDALARDAIASGLVGRLSPARLRDELVLLLDEPQAAESLRRVRELGLDRAIDPRVTADDEVFLRLRELRDRYAVGIPAWRLGLATLARDLGADARAWLDALKLRRQDARAIAAAVSAGPKLAEEARRVETPAEVVALADPYPPDAPLFALALGDAPALHDYFGRLREVRLEVDGSDLAELGLEESPRVGEVLSELRRRKLNGELDSRDSELAAAKELIAQ
jgi:tRNA nucleotidyltransferase (CCA-adding enzyme)